MSSAGFVPEIAGTNDFDVLCGRGDFCNKATGNLQFRTWAQLFKDQYIMGPKPIKVQLCARIVGMVQVSGGRFLIVDENESEWVEASHKRALEKTSQALRDMGHENVFDDKSLKRFRKRFYKLWDSKAVRKRAQFLLQSRHSTRNVILSTDVASHLYVPTSDAFIPPPSPPEDDEDRSAEASSSRGRSVAKRQKRPRLSYQELSDEESRPRSKSRKKSSGKKNRKSLSSKKKSKKKKHKKRSSSQKPQVNYIYTTLSGQPMRVANLDLEDIFSDDSDDNSEEGIDWDITARIRRTHLTMSKEEHRRELYDFNLNLPDTDSEEDVPLYGALHDLDELVALGVVKAPQSKTTEVASPPKDGDNVDTNIRKSATPRKLRARPQKNDNDDEMEGKKRSATMSQKFVHIRNEYPKYFGPGQPVMFAGVATAPSSSVTISGTAAAKKDDTSPPSAGGQVTTVVGSDKSQGGAAGSGSETAIIIADDESIIDPIVEGTSLGDTPSSVDGSQVEPTAVVGDQSQEEAVGATSETAITIEDEETPLPVAEASLPVAVSETRATRETLPMTTTPSEAVKPYIRGEDEEAPLAEILNKDDSPLSSSSKAPPQGKDATDELPEPSITDKVEAHAAVDPKEMPASKSATPLESKRSPDSSSADTEEETKDIAT